MTVKLNILIATSNRPSELRRLLLSLEAQTNTNFSITVVDSSSSAQSRDVVDSVRNKLHIQYFAVSTGGSCTQRNFGLSLIEENVVLISDDDCVFAEGSIAEVFKYLNDHPEVAAFSLRIIEDTKLGKTLLNFLRKPLGLSAAASNFIVRKNGINARGKDDCQLVQWVASCAMVLVRENITGSNLLRFNTELERVSRYASGEDAYLTYKLYLTGHKLGVASGAEVAHIPAEGGRGDRRLLQQARAYNRYVLWRDLIYPFYRLSVIDFVISNFVLLLIYLVSGAATRDGRGAGHLNGLRLAYHDWKARFDEKTYSG